MSSFLAKGLRISWLLFMAIVLVGERQIELTNSLVGHMGLILLALLLLLTKDEKTLTLVGCHGGYFRLFSLEQIFLTVLVREFIKDIVCVESPISSCLLSLASSSTTPPSLALALSIQGAVFSNIQFIFLTISLIITKVLFFL